MFKQDKKWWLAAALLCLMPATMVARPQRDRDRGCDPGHRDRRCQQVPEGGSAAIYLLGIGVTCLGAMFLRSRFSKAEQH